MTTILLDITDGIALISLNRPTRNNAWTVDMEHAYFDALQECAERTDVRAIVVTGRGKSFCVGADLEELRSIESTSIDDWAPRDPRSPYFAVSIPKPVIAAVNGGCAGMGIVLAAMSDIRFSAPEVKFSTAFARRGLVAEHGLSWILPRIIGVGSALDLLMSGRVVNGDEMASLGLVDRLVDDAGSVLPAALEYARELALHSAPESMAAVKSQVYADLTRTREEALGEANSLMRQSLTRPSFAEGVASFEERRPPQFPGVSSKLEA